jgi:hypothetical protein
LDARSFVIRVRPCSWMLDLLLIPIVGR